MFISSNKGLIHKVIHKAQFGNVKFCQVKVFLFASLWPQRMDLHVVPQITRGGEGSGALLAWVRLLLDVGHPVIVEVRAGGETFATNFAHMWLLASVDPSVCV